MTGRFLQSTLFIACLIMVAGCGSTRLTGKQNVLFYDHVGVAPENTVRLYIDRQGSLYPQSGFSDSYIPFNDSSGDTLHAVVDHKTVSRSWIRRSVPILFPDPNPRPWHREFCKDFDPADKSDASVLCTHVDGEGDVEVTDPENVDLSSWRGRQQVLWDRAGAKIHETATSEGQNRTIVFLIHGFNVPNARQPYQVAKESLEGAKGDGEKLLFVEIHWDGWTSPSGFGVWGEAQTSGPLVGFELRQLFNAIADAYGSDIASRPNVRVLAHSSGAIVVGSLFGNPIAALPNLRNTNRNSDYNFFAANLAPIGSRYRIPNFPDVRIGMLAAATPASTFVGRMPRRNVVSFPRDAGHPDAGILSENTTLLISVNEKDFALTKGGVGPNAAQTGASGLGSIPATYCELELRLNTNRTPKVSAFGFNFNRAGGTWDEYEDVHDFPLYLAQADANSDGFSFLKFLMGTVSDETARRHAIPCSG